MGKYYTFENIKGDNIENLLLILQDLLNSKKITNNLPDDTKLEIDNLYNELENNINNILNKLSKDNTKDSSNIIIDAGEY